MDKHSLSPILTDDHVEELKLKGYTVVRNVMTSAECDETVRQYRDWLSQFKDDDWPISRYSLIQRYNTGHMHPTWFVRLKSKKVFAEVWKTDKLLTSFDAIAIGRPPENGEEYFYRPNSNWLHVDQSASRVGLHAYQGAVYLEEACEDDWSLQVMEGSHIHFNDLFENNPKARLRSNLNNFYRLKDDDLTKMETQHGCAIKRVPVPKGGMVLWDSRLVHANASPMEGRKHPGRWRFCVFVSMTPAIWARKQDIQLKRDAYGGAYMTTHWSSQGVQKMGTSPILDQHQHISIPDKIPVIGQSTEAKLLSGVIPYNFKDGKPTGNEMKPTWLIPDENKRKMAIGKLVLVFSAAVAITGYVIYRLSAK